MKIRKLQKFSNKVYRSPGKFTFLDGNFPWIDGHFPWMITNLGKIFFFKHKVAAVKWSMRLQALPMVYGSNPPELFKLFITKNVQGKI
jgi:hypothetical protein